MGENSAIEWTDHTFNPWIGCQHVSPGCDHCYAETMMDHRYPDKPAKLHFSFSKLVIYRKMKSDISP
jgi:DNA repair photolyase